MEEKKEIKIRLSTVIYLLIIVSLVVTLGVTYYFGFIANKNENVGDEKVTDTTENVVLNTDTESKKEENKVEENKISNTIKDETEEKEETTDLKGNKLIQFDTEFYSIEDVAKVSKECEKVKNFVDYEYDLDGDGVKDKITMKKTDGVEFYYNSFRLNGKEFLKDETAYNLYIVDLNENDNKLEVIIATYGGSDRICYMIYSKDGSKMKEIKNVTGIGFITDKKGKIVCPDFTMGIEPEVYNEYYYIERGKITVNKLDINKIKDVDFTLEPEIYYFSKNIDNFKGADIEDLEKSDIERLDETTKCRIIKFVHDNGIDFIYIELPNGNRGYITTAYGWLAS